MDLLYRHMETADEPKVRELTKKCHPTWPARPKFWYHANPTIVCSLDLDGERIVGYGSYTVDNHPAGSSFIQYLRDSAVDPDYRGQGIGRTLIQKRMYVGRQVGCAMFVGMTGPRTRACGRSSRPKASTPARQCRWPSSTTTFPMMSLLRRDRTGSSTSTLAPMTTHSPEECPLRRWDQPTCPCEN